MKKLQVYALYKGDYLSEMGVIEFPNVLEMERRIGGTIEQVPINQDLVFIRGAEYNFLKVPVNRLWFKDNNLHGVLYGDAFVAKIKEDGNYAPIFKSDIDFIEKSFRPVVFQIPNKIYSYIKEDLTIGDWEIK